MTLDTYHALVERAKSMRIILSGEQKVDDMLMAMRLSNEESMLERAGIT